MYSFLEIFVQIKEQYKLHAHREQINKVEKFAQRGTKIKHPTDHIAGHVGLKVKRRLIESIHQTVQLPHSRRQTKQNEIDAIHHDHDGDSVAKTLVFFSFRAAMAHSGASFFYVKK